MDTNAIAELTQRVSRVEMDVREALSVAHSAKHDRAVPVDLMHGGCQKSIEAVQERLDEAVLTIQDLKAANERLRKLARAVVDSGEMTSGRPQMIRDLRKELYVQEGH